MSPAELTPRENRLRSTTPADSGNEQTLLPAPHISPAADAAVTVSGIRSTAAFIAAETQSQNDTGRSAEAAQAALAALSADVRQINQTYLHHVQHRSLMTAEESAAVLPGRQVAAFLRHDRVRVFTVVCDGRAGMADFVTLRDVRFHVDPFGRQQSNAENGPLPNRRTVHAYLTGTLQSISDSEELPDATEWEPVRYLPLEDETFVRAESGRPILTCREIRLAPGRLKVWCPRR
ncbi:MAG: hypothetical protein KDA89_22000 [Planctomycetaceae bacterium]|nr:hypothetical protein [Planctomycetaceae bacterium]